MEIRNHIVASTELTSWVHFDHDADIGVRGSGRTLAEAFEQTALAMTAIVTDAKIAPKTAVTISCRAPDIEVLLVDWLNALVFEMATQQMLFSRFDVTIENELDWQLQATAWGDTVNRKSHAPAVEVKGATFTELCVRQEANGVWKAQCIVDV